MRAQITRDGDRSDDQFDGIIAEGLPEPRNEEHETYSHGSSSPARGLACHPKWHCMSGTSILPVTTWVIILDGASCRVRRDVPGLGLFKLGK